MKAGKYIVAAVLVGVCIFAQNVYAFNGVGGFNGQGGNKMMHFGGSSLVVGSDGTSYVTSINTANVSSMADLTTNLTAISSSGSKQSVTLNGLVRKLVIGQGASSNNYLVAPAVVKSSTASSPSTVLYIVPLPFSQSVTPITVSLQGGRPSRPQIVNGNIYITTTVWTQSTTGGTPTKTSYLNIVGLNGSIISQVSF